MSGANFDPTNLNDTAESRTSRTETTNQAGGTAWEPDEPRVELYKNVLNNLLEDTYYQDATELFADVGETFVATVEDGHYQFPLQLATYARHEGGYRDIAQVLLVLAANWGKRELEATVPFEGSWSTEWSDSDGPSPTQEFVREYTPSIIDRTDEFNTIVATQIALFGKPLPNALRNGIEDGLHKRYAVLEYPEGGTERVTYIEGRNPEKYDFGQVKVLDEGYIFDEYTFAKYRQPNRDVSLVDVIQLVRPNPRSDNRDDLFGRLVRGDSNYDHFDDVEPLRNERTWESERSSDTTTFEFDTSEWGLDETHEQWPVTLHVDSAADVTAVTDGEASVVDKGWDSDTDTYWVDVELTESQEWRHRLDDIGLMARCRNLRNMREAGLSGEEIFDYDDGEFGEESRCRVREHQQFPFRYYQAYKALDNSSGISRRGSTFEIRGDLLDDATDEWLNGAIDASIENLPEELESTFTAVDLSGSMDREVANESTLSRAEIASLFGSIVTKHGGDVGAFGSDFALADVSDNARETMPTLEMARELYAMSNEVGNATNGYKAIQWATEEGVEYDRFVIFTDEQLWDTAGFRSDRTLKDVWDDYREQVNPDAHLYVVDLASYGEYSAPQGYTNVHQISGWHSDVIEFVSKVEQVQDVIADIASIEAGEY